MPKRKFSDLTPEEQKFYSGFKQMVPDKKAQAVELAHKIIDFNHHLPSELFTDLANAVYSLKRYSEGKMD